MNWYVDKPQRGLSRANFTVLTLFFKEPISACELSPNSSKLRTVIFIVSLFIRHL